MSRFLIYGLTDPDGTVRYIGKSTSGLFRPRAHGGAALKNDRTHKGNWIRSIRARGLDYGVRVLEIVTDASALSTIEIRWIAYGRAEGWPLTNLTDGGEGAHGAIRTAEQRARLSAALRGKPHPWNAGRNKSPEVIAKIKAALTGRVRSASHCAAIAIANKGRVATTETRARLRTAHLGMKQSDETKAKRAASRKAWAATDEGKATISRVAAETGMKLKGRKHSPETIAKMSAATKGRPKSPETRARMVVAQRLRADAERGTRKISAAHRAALRAGYDVRFAPRRPAMTFNLIGGEK